ncbi:hypothetical protein VB780_14655 [Leptolyngbya sp. CCNP1308]|uniref:hypothetical protein n=1 Tax=Leptolyngbya sp. CCNP1308 TaxID=3110255 RepID=UPI002B21B01E|nr:hypothetical protein [Leptolyngbya sp. CCNP1308]MEA5449821.1 hypothetical protein [Leptolyngbya sp. CCNP1308]
MQIPENPTNSDIRDALIDLRHVIDEVRSEVRGEIDDVRRDIKSLGDKVDKQDYKFDAYQKGIDGMVRMSITIIIATATVAVLPSLSPAITAIINAITSGSQ